MVESEFMKRKHLAVLIAGLTALAAAGFVTTPRQQDLVVHEWGTFTSLQGSDGIPLKWNPFESSKLPGFVYDWNRPGFERRPTGMLALGLKNALVTLQRMETPVVYFYSPKEMSVDLSVGFPRGGITEWYPQAAEVGPCVYPPNPIVSSLDSGVHHFGLASSFTLSSVFEPRKVKESLIHWPDLKILPAREHPDLAERLAHDSSGSHYFAARETDSAFVRLSHTGETNSSVEFEKFLFYRGVGNFAAPLQVEMPKDGVVLVSNTGTEPLDHLFILEIQGNRGELLSMDRLRPGEQRSAALDLDKRSRPLEVLRADIEGAMARSLQAEGLYPREAAAMVRTWEDSWFAEQGVRVLYILPRNWTDQTLPMTIEPKPKELVRVMVGRAELIATGTEKQLARELVQAKQDRVAAQEEFSRTLDGLGRFAQPAFDRALDRAELQPSDRDRLRSWFYEVRNRKR